MDHYRLARAATAVALVSFMLSAPAAWAEFLGGVAGVSHSLFVSETDVAKSSAAARLEWGFGPQLKAQLDGSFSGLHALDDTALNLTGHLGWSFGDVSTIGLFYGWDKVDGSEDFYGIEYAGAFGAADVEGYLAAVDSNGTMLGMAARMPLSGGFGVGASFDYMDANAVGDATRLGIGGDYALGQATRISGEIGHFDGDDRNGNSASEAYLKLGVDFAFGPAARTSFGSRSLFNFAPGL